MSRGGWAARFCCWLRPKFICGVKKPPCVGCLLWPVPRSPPGRFCHGKWHIPPYAEAFNPFLIWKILITPALEDLSSEMCYWSVLLQLNDANPTGDDFLFCPLHEMAALNKEPTTLDASNQASQLVVRELTTVLKLGSQQQKKRLTEAQFSIRTKAAGAEIGFVKYTGDSFPTLSYLAFFFFLNKTLD